MADFLTYSADYLKKVSVINDNTDNKILTPTILLVQDMYLKPLLGTDLFNEVKEQIIAGTVNADNQTLLDEYILNIVHYYVLYEATPLFKYKYMNRGIMVNNAENSTSADLTEVKFMMDNWKNKAEWFSERMIKFIKRVNGNDPTKYTKYRENYDCDDIKPIETDYKTSIYLGDTDLTEKELYNIRRGNY